VWIPGIRLVCRTPWRYLDAAVAESPTPARNAAELLRRSLVRGRLGHAYLFSGDDIDVLEAAAIDLALLLACESPSERAENGAALAACRQCSHCRRIANRTHPDVNWVYPESKIRQITVDQTREIIRILNLRPSEAPRKLAVFSGADRLNPGAANAFLKTLEEPPAGSVILMLSTEPDRVLETILSRCLRLSFGAGTLRMPDTVRAWVTGFAREVAVAKPGLLPRYRLLGNLLEGLATTRASVEETLAAESPLERYPDASADQKEHWERELTAGIEAEYRRRRGEFLAGLQAWLRDVWLCASGQGGGALFLPEVAEISASVAARGHAEAARSNLDAWEQTQRLLHTNVQEALALEVGLLRLHL